LYPSAETGSQRSDTFGASPDRPRRPQYELPLPPSGRFPAGAPEHLAAAALPESLLVRSVLWFCRLRWVVAGFLAAFGAVGLFPELLPRIGLRGHPEWPLVAAGVLMLANVGFLAHGRRLRSAAARGVEANLWAQIVVDLLVLTVVVHYVGSLETYAAFAYLLHIVLACIFFPRSRSLVVTAIACVLYVGCVALEQAGVIPPAGIYADAALRGQIARTPGALLLNVSLATATWVVVWYLASRLSAMVRERDEELAATNRRLVEAQEEKTRHMVRTTHELKAPFAAIDANVQLLLKGHCGPLPGQAYEVVERIATRCRLLAVQIQEVLQVANLRAASREPPRRVQLDLVTLLRWCLGQVRPVAEEREVVLEEDLRPSRIDAVEDHMKMLFSNLLRNAVRYSHGGGRVLVRCAADGAGGAAVTVEDHGIGIPPDKLPRIFEPHYRTDEAVRHYKESTGLGLAIVQQVAETHGIRVRVESAPGAGTKFTLTFPSAQPDRGPEGGRPWPI